MLDSFYWFGMENHDNFLRIDIDLMTYEEQMLITCSILIKIGFTLYFVFVSLQIYDHFRDEKIIQKLSADREEARESFV